MGAFRMNLVDDTPFMPLTHGCGYASNMVWILFPINLAFTTHTAHTENERWDEFTPMDKLLDS